MRCVIQRVDRVNVRVGDRYITGIEKGILLFLGVEEGDKESDADYILDKIINLRIFENERKKMNLSLLNTSGEMLVVSQFTLFADCRKGRRPSFSRAENLDQARTLYDYFIRKAQEKVKRVAHGQFQAMMFIELVNNGPVTVLLDSRQSL